MSGEQSVVSDSKSSTGPDYESLEIPTKNPEEYTYAERRAELYKMIGELDIRR